MRQRDLREHVFKLLFMTEFNTQEEMPEQLSMYLEGFPEKHRRRFRKSIVRFFHIQKKSIFF